MKKTSIAQAFQMAGYKTVSGYNSIIKCYAIYAYAPNSESHSYLCKRQLNGEYHLYNANGECLLIVRDKMNGIVIFSKIENIAPSSEKVSLLVDSIEFRKLCESAKLTEIDLAKLFSISHKKAAAWMNHRHLTFVPDKAVIKVKRIIKEGKKGNTSEKE